MTVTTHYTTSAPATSNDYEAYIDRKAGSGDSIMSEGISVLYKFMTLFTDLTQGKYDQMSAKADRARTSQQVANQVDAIISQLAKAGDKEKLPDDVIKYLRDHHIPITAQNDGKNSTSDIDSYLKQYGSLPVKPEGYTPGCTAKDGFDLPKWAESVTTDELRNLPFIQNKWGVYQKALSYIYDRDMANRPANPPLDKGQLDVIKGALETDSGRCSDFVTQAQLQIQKTMQSYNVCVSLVNSMQTLLAEMNKSIAQNIR